MANLISLPLQERIPRNNILQRATDIIIFFLFLSLLSYRFLTLSNHGVAWLLAFLCESWFTLCWVLTINSNWNPVEYRTYPERLLQRVGEVPSVDMFVTTADPLLEPPIITVNTVLSLLAVDYPAHKLACYVSDDGASLLTFYSLVEASKFAKLWVPFCKKYSIRVRAPFVYFSTEIDESLDLSPDFRDEWKTMKNEYKQLRRRIEEAVQKNYIAGDLTGDFAAFSKIDPKNHPSIVKVIWENKENLPDGLPHLIYVSREKRPVHPHHFKAGAMNVLTRVSGVMTNSPFILNVDCDMFVNNPQTILHAMCLLLGFEQEKESGFVQFPQIFYRSLKDDPFGNNQFIVFWKFIMPGIVGIQGPFYGGTGCFHRRKVIYGLSPDEATIQGAMETTFGNSVHFMKSVPQILSGIKDKTDCQPADLSSTEEAANEVASCVYEYNTSWGERVGWVYGSATEDVLTGLRIHSKGWRSGYCTPDPPAFLGDTPSGGPAILTQQKRWATGLLEILVSNYNPILGVIKGKLLIRQCLVYLSVIIWPLRALPELCYALLPPYCILTTTYFLPTVWEPAIFVPSALFVILNLYNLSYYLRCGLSIRSWWNNQRMTRIISATS
uniref:Cellulose synthase-like protein H1 n=1 Tax=Nelumbo nucifera TaxID=4432 RepID=A0A822XWE2_NELNU|nr:TPA_asm: hypothetical protein HUJ06_024892 [Nelumbo nucifera]